MNGNIKSSLTKDTNSLRGKTFLFVGPYPPPFGGVSSHLAELARGFADSGCNFHVLHFDLKSSKKEYVNGAYVYRINNRLSFDMIHTTLRFPARIFPLLCQWIKVLFKAPRLFTASLFKAIHIASLSDKITPGVVTIYTTKVGALIPFLRCLRPKMVIHYCTYADPFINPVFYQKHNKWFKRAILSSNKVFSSSAYCASAIKLFTKDVIPEVIYVGVDIERFHPIANISEPRKKLGLPQDKPIVLFVGRMETEMGADAAFNIAVKMTSENNTIIFVIVGAKGSLTEAIEQGSKNSQERIFCRVNVSAKDLPDYYAAATLVIAPTIGVHACMGVSIKEAMASGKPSVVSNSGGIPEAIRDGVDGYIVPLTIDGTVDENSFISAINIILSDSNKCYEFGKEARNRAEVIFSNNTTINKYAQILVV